MSEPHKCPNCEGSGKIPDPEIISSGTYIVKKECPSCEGKGIVWNKTETITYARYAYRPRRSTWGEWFFGC